MGGDCMSKPKRNDSCSCGSGKKFKKCCGKSNVIAFNSTLYKDELDRLHQQLIHFTFENHEEDLIDIMEHFAEKLLFDWEEKDLNIFRELIIGWAIFAVPVHNKDTLFTLFYEKVKNKIRYPAVRKTFASWSAAQTGIFEVLPTKDHIELRDLTTGKRFPTLFDEEDELEQDSIVIGTFIPYIDTYESFLLMVQLPGVHVQEISDLISEKLPDDLTMKDVFPQFLADVLSPIPALDMDQLSWEHIDHEIVAHLFLEHATKKGYDNELIQMTIQFWSEYCKLKYPIIRKHAAHAAALDYFSQVEFFPFTDVTQTELAKEYGTSAGTISNHYGRLSEEFEIATSVVTPNISSPPVNMEKQMRDLMGLLGEQEFESEDEVNDFLQEVVNFDDLPTSEDSRDIAQDILFDAGEASGKKRKQLIQQALDVHQLSSDAYLLLAEEERDTDKRLKLLEKAIGVGEQDLGNDFLKENRGHFWGLIETRPYMRAKATYGIALENSDFTGEAIEAYTELLELNPSDNQGIRYMLLPLYIMEGDFKEAHALIREYDESTATILFSKALLHFNENGMTKDGLKMLREADKHNPYVIDYLLGRKKIPNKRPEYIGLGDELEAIAYVQENEHLWTDATVFLKKMFSEN